MQDRYVADVGDFGKFQLFRYLFNHQESPLDGKALAQIWFMHKGEDETNNDGRHIDYFERMMGTDEYLEYSLMDILMRDKREVTELEEMKLLKNAIFYYNEVPKALEDRYLWLNNALTFASKSQIVAVAPDNGMALKCNRADKCFEYLTLNDHYQQKVYPHKYIFADEVSYFYRLPYLEICIVYQHLSRCFSHDEQIESLLVSLKDEYRHVIAIKHKPYSPRVFFFLCKSDIILDALKLRLKEFENSFNEFWQLFE
ncbi:hypothetical protein PGH07_05130 [Sulfurovum sp. zt1-1]|uniref:Uncharacterized protein n=1 Tax=Sulfurovum zhangzhouensis TaxID=3019067 RepID=A0ABT7QXI8_9BACT|nr:hypothetical protein [Sulfurovum zhangzhouensis]MDM5271549.1 hypothetical protein [Sulfurovum zhangzhouensis]